MENLLILPLALVIDLAFGEYPHLLHPVDWIGQAISWLLKFTPKNSVKGQFVYGIFIVLLTLALFIVPVYFVLFYLRGVSTIAYVVVAALILKSTFSLRELRRTAQKVKRLLDAGEITEARKETSYLVSRDTRNLDRGHIISAIVEMTAESVTDSLVAPLFYWLLLGVPGAIAYRIVNTFDSRIGYRGQYEYLGKFAARLDDVLNYIPARLSGLLLVISAHLGRTNGGRAWRLMLRDHARAESPNAGWTMCAMAGALEVQLEKPGCYRFGDTGKPLALSSITDGLRLVAISFALWFAICMSITGVRYALTA
ncbi:cobalamin biosynthesis protein [Chloroflexota bacterium]